MPQSILQKIREELRPYAAELIAVSKTKTEREILELYAQGQRHFGENRVQELLPKQEALPKDIHWHLIGHLQRNKVKQVVPFVYLIHSVDSERLLFEIDRQAQAAGRQIDCLLQFKIAREETKYGFELDQARQMLESEAFSRVQHLRICGVMGMASFSDDTELVRSEFAQLRTIFQNLKQDFFSEALHFKELSMGMSGDYPIALEEGSTMLRIGTLLFGPRMYADE